MDTPTKYIAQSHQEAQRLREAGIKVIKYTGKPCNKCGESIRYAIGGNCVTCVKQRRQNRDPLHRVWVNMRQRCNNPNVPNYESYGGRGITVCDRWASFEAFAADMGERPSPAHSIDRIDNDNGYSPDNCRWATKKEQARNTRKTELVDFFGELVPLVELAETYGQLTDTLRYRLKQGWCLYAALSVTGYTRKSPCVLAGPVEA